MDRKVTHYLGKLILKSYSRAALCLCGLLVATAQVYADDAQWLPIRDQNPFVLGSGLPLLPQSTQPAGTFTIEALIDESNSELISSTAGHFPNDPGTHVVYGGETRETRVTVGYSFGDGWSGRASIGDEWMGVGFLDKPIQHFHDLIGAPKGFRNGRLGERPPVVRVTDNGTVLYQVNNFGQSIAPLLFDVSRTFRTSDTTSYGITVGVKVAAGESKMLTDTGDHGVSLAAFGSWTFFDFLQTGARIGYLHSSGNEVLPSLAKSGVPFADLYARAPLWGRWSFQIQYDAHGALYRNVPIYLDKAGLYTFGLVRPIGERSELIIGVSEDLPIGHTQDVSFLLAYRYRPGN